MSVQTSKFWSVLHIVFYQSDKKTLVYPGAMDNTTCNTEELTSKTDRRSTHNDGTTSIMLQAVDLKPCQGNRSCSTSPVSALPLNEMKLWTAALHITKSPCRVTVVFMKWIRLHRKLTCGCHSSASVKGGGIGQRCGQCHGRCKHCPHASLHPRRAINRYCTQIEVVPNSVEQRIIIDRRDQAAMC